MDTTFELTCLVVESTGLPCSPTSSCPSTIVFASFSTSPIIWCHLSEALLQTSNCTLSNLFISCSEAPLDTVAGFDSMSSLLVQTVFQLCNVIFFQQIGIPDEIFDKPAMVLPVFTYKPRIACLFINDI